MARTFSHIPDPHFAQKSKEAENGGGGDLPPVTPENAGEFLRVNDAGKISTDVYPIERQTNVLYDDNVSMESYEVVNLVEYTNVDNFPNLIVEINGFIIEYTDGVYQYTDDNTTLVIELDSDYIAAGTGEYTVTDMNVKITEPVTIIDPLFAKGVEEIAKNLNVPFTKIVVFDGDERELPINAILNSTDILSLMGGNSVTKPLAYLNIDNPRTHLIVSVDNGETQNLVILNLNMLLTLNQITYSGILTVQTSTVILSAYVTRNENIAEAVITATTVS